MLRTRSLRAAALLTLAAATDLLSPRDAGGQNPISSKVVGSEVARRNRKLLSRYAARTSPKPTAASDTVRSRIAAQVRRTAADPAVGALAARLPVAAVRRLMATEVAEFLRLTDPADTLPLASRARWSKVEIRCVAEALGARPRMATARDTLSSAYLLELLCQSPELTTVVPNAIRLALWEAQREDSVLTREAFENDVLAMEDPVVEVIAAGAIDRTLRAVEKGHTNPQRFYVGGQLGMRLVGGDDDNGIIGRASVRAAYFIPISPLAWYQLPVVTNLGDVAAAPKESQKDKLRKLTTASEGAFLSLEPTFDPIVPGPLKDMRVQLFGAVGGQINTLRDVADTSDVQVAQGRVGAGANFEIGIPSSGRPNLFMSSRVVWRFASGSALQRVFGSREKLQPVIESFALIPIGAGMSLLGEVSATKGSAPVVRIALWAQATAQKSSGQ